MGGNVKETLFGTVTTTDVEQLQETFDPLENRKADIVHSLSNQRAFVKKLDTLTKINLDAHTNFSSIVKYTIVQSHERFQQLTRDIIWLNVTIYNQSELYMKIRQLEFVLLQLSQQIDELVAKVKYVLQGKSPINFICPATLYNILRNVSLHIPENYE